MWGELFRTDEITDNDKATIAKARRKSKEAEKKSDDFLEMAKLKQKEVKAFREVDDEKKAVLAEKVMENYTSEAESMLFDAADALWQVYWDLRTDKTGKDFYNIDKVDRELGINQYAAPKIGEGFMVVSSQFDSNGGFSKKDRGLDQTEEDRLLAEVYKAEYNYHFAGVVLQSQDGKDVVTLENYTVQDKWVVNEKWKFNLYNVTGKNSQDFHFKRTRDNANIPGRPFGYTPTTFKVGPNQDE